MYLLRVISPVALAARHIVKSSGYEVVASSKCLMSLGVAPVFYAVYVTLTTKVIRKAGAPFERGFGAPVLAFVTLLIVNYSAIVFGDIGAETLQ